LNLLPHNSFIHFSFLFGTFDNTNASRLSELYRQEATHKTRDTDTAESEKEKERERKKKEKERFSLLQNVYHGRSSITIIVIRAQKRQLSLLCEGVIGCRRVRSAHGNHFDRSVVQVILIAIFAVIGGNLGDALCYQSGRGNVKSADRTAQVGHIFALGFRTQ
jgi:hypothetical protein